MNLLAHVIQVAILGAVLAGALIYLAGLAIVDHRQSAASLLAATDALCGWCGGGGCDECDPDAARDDPGADWDRARDRDIDYRAGVA